MDENEELKVCIEELAIKRLHLHLTLAKECRVKYDPKNKMSMCIDAIEEMKHRISCALEILDDQIVIDGERVWVKKS